MAAYVTAIVAGAVISLAFVLTFVRWSGPGVLPPVTEEAFAAARERWEESGPADYDIEVTVSGRAAAVYRVSVRGGEPTAASRNGQPLAQRRTWHTWSVPGMFETIASDLDVVARISAGKAVPGLVPLDVRGTFDPHYGYPTRYQRIELIRFGSNQEVVWEVTRWEPLEPAGARPTDSWRDDNP